MSSVNSDSTPLTAEQMKPLIEKKVSDEDQKRIQDNLRMYKEGRGSCQYRMPNFNKDFLERYNSSSYRSEMSDYWNCSNEIAALGYNVHRKHVFHTGSSMTTTMYVYLPETQK